MTRGIAVTFLAIAAILAGRPVTAHHSFAAEYDRDKPVILAGAVTKVEWMNPHIYFYMDVTGKVGKAAAWAVEGGAPNTLYRAGWRKDSLKVGDLVTVNGYLARDGTNLANMRTVVLADGRSLFGGQRDGGPDAPGSTAPKRPPGR